MPKKGLFAGKKLAKSHSTVIAEAVRLIEYAKTLPEITKIVPSEINPLKPSSRHLKTSQVPAGLKLAVRGLNARQVIYIYTLSPEQTLTTLNQFWQKTYPN
jgi:hypothetical protein